MEWKSKRVSCVQLLWKTEVDCNSLSIPTGSGLSIEIDATNTAFNEGSNTVEVILLAADGTTEVDRKTFTVEITRRKAATKVMTRENKIFLPFCREFPSIM